MMQAGFLDIKIDGRSIRVDMLMWIPEDDRCRIVVECDGFQYHRQKASFVSDRRRDRALKAEGYEVLRYSGSEMFHNPVETGYDLFDYLEKQIECEDS